MAHVHHIKPMSEYPDLVLDQSNLESLCHSCHSRESMHALHDKNA